jgi:CHAT domain-containing protein
LGVALDHFRRVVKQLEVEFAAKPAPIERLTEASAGLALQSTLRKLGGVAAIYTITDEKKYRAILVTPSTEKKYEHEIGAAELNGMVAAFLKALQNPAIDPRPLGRALYDILIGPEMARDIEQAKVSTLMWSLDGSLRYAPMAALYDGSRYLAERYATEVFTRSSLQNLPLAPEENWRAAGFGLTKAYPHFDALRGVSDELNSIIHAPGGSGVMPGKVRMDEQFTKDSVLDAMRDYPVVHIASHFNLQPGDEKNSFLLLGDGSSLTLEELHKMSSVDHLDLLTLSACNTGVAGNGIEVEGLGETAQERGAKAVLASLWPVSDESTSVLMAEFYRIHGSRPGMSKAEALREAQVEMLRGEAGPDGAANRAARRGAVPVTDENAPGTEVSQGWSHPYHWAAFFLMGNWR